MESESVAARVGDELVRTGRRAKYLKEASGIGPWSDIVLAGLMFGPGVWLILLDPSPAPSMAGVMLVFSSFFGWHYRRLTNRVNALAKLLAEVIPATPADGPPDKPLHLT